jgi:ParB/RepB/Spo0J family partition protein
MPTATRKTQTDFDTAHIFPIGEMEVGDAPDNSHIYFAPPGRFVPNPNQPRRSFQPKDLEELAANIKDLREQGHGIGGTGFLLPIKVRFPPGVLDARGRLKTTDFKWPITIGESRWRSGIIAESPLIPYTVEDLNEEQAHELAFYENVHRANMSWLDTALAMERIMRQNNLSQRTMAARIGKDKNFVQLHMDALKAGDDAKSILDVRPDALFIVQRIDAVKDNPKLRAELIRKAKNHAPTKAIVEQIKEYNQKKKQGGGHGEAYGSEAPRGTKRLLSRDVGNDLNHMMRTGNLALDAVRGVPLQKSQRAAFKAQLLNIREWCDSFETAIGARDS